ncbi:hypothetical protein BH18ACT15_BH18ACT15_11760 [soil metagenome]
MKEFSSHPVTSVRRASGDRVGVLEVRKEHEVAVRKEALGVDRGAAADGGAAIYVFPAPGGRPEPQERMLARRRRALAVAAMVVTLGMAAVAALTVPPASVPSRDGPRTLVMRPDDSLWGVAERFAPPDGDLRTYVQSVMELNDLHGVPRVGQSLRLPAAP